MLLVSRRLSLRLTGRTATLGCALYSSSLEELLITEILATAFLVVSCEFSERSQPVTEQAVDALPGRYKAKAWFLRSESISAVAARGQNVVYLF